MTTPREAVRAAILSRDEALLVRAMGRFRNSADGAKVAQEELDKADTMTRLWWAEPEPNCDGINCGHDHALVVEGVKGWLEG